MGKTDYMTILEIKAAAGTGIGTVLTFVWSEAGVIYFAGLGSGILISVLTQKYNSAYGKRK